MSIESCDGLTITSNEGTLFKAFRNTEGLGIRILRNFLLNVFMKCFFHEIFLHIHSNEWTYSILQQHSSPASYYFLSIYFIVIMLLFYSFCFQVLKMFRMIPSCLTVLLASLVTSNTTTDEEWTQCQAGPCECYDRGTVLTKTVRTETCQLFF